MALQSALYDLRGYKAEIQSVKFISRGSASIVGSVLHADGADCFKYSCDANAMSMYSAECESLEVLWETESVEVPIAQEPVEIEGGGALLLMDLIESAPKKPNYWALFADDLAGLHQKHAPKFGLSFDNYMGRLSQSNTWHATFEDFFWNERLVPQLKLARDSGKLTAKQVRQFDVLQTRLADICPQEPPALIHGDLEWHGDLWSGNAPFITGRDGYAALIDPAIAYFCSHRECDLAMTRLFGGFAPEFYSAYNDALHCRACHPFHWHPASTRGWIATTSTRCSCMSICLGAGMWARRWRRFGSLCEP